METQGSKGMRPTAADELGHLTASEMMRVTRAHRDAKELAKLMALYEGGEVQS